MQDEILPGFVTSQTRLNCNDASQAYGEELSGEIFTEIETHNHR